MHLAFLDGNWIDLIILFVIIIYSISGFTRGFILGFMDLGGFLISFAVAIKTYYFFGEILIARLSLPKGISNALGFLLAGILTEVIITVLINILTRYIYPIWKTKTDHKPVRIINKLNRMFGVIPVFGEALVIISFLLTILISLPIQGGVKKAILSAKIGGALVQSSQSIEKQINNIFGQAVNETLNFLTVNPNPLLKEKVDLGFTQRDLKTDQESEMVLLNLVNGERQKNGLKKLIINQSAQESARIHATDMFVRGYFSHSNPENETPFERLKRNGVSFLAAGENLAFAPNVYLAHQGLMNSPGHRANILSADFDKIGIGVIDGGIYGEMFVQEFTD